MAAASSAPTTVNVTVPASSNSTPSSSVIAAVYWAAMVILFAMKSAAGVSPSRYSAMSIATPSVFRSNGAPSRPTKLSVPASRFAFNVFINVVAAVSTSLGRASSSKVTVMSSSVMVTSAISILFTSAAK